MKLRMPLVAGAAVAALVAGLALPAHAADTATTFQIDGGTLSISVAPTASLGVA